MSIVWNFNSFFSRVRANIFLLNPFLFFTRSIKMSNEPPIIFPCTLREKEKALKRYMNFQLSLFLESSSFSRVFFNYITSTRGSDMPNEFPTIPLGLVAIYSSSCTKRRMNFRWVYRYRRSPVLRKSGCYTFSRQESVYNNYHYTIITILNQHFVLIKRQLKNNRRAFN